MSVNVLYCSMSPWRGDNELCAWCNVQPRRGGRRFCSRECVQEYADNHYYARAKKIVLDASKGPCACPDSLTPQGGYIDMEDMRVKYLKIGKKPHRRCNACGQCEEQVAQRDDTLSVNHIDPRNGISMGIAHCIHHVDNLEVLCWRDHGLLNQLGNVRSRLTSWKDHQ